ncbi:MAG: WG repeat-containing protein [Flavobacteriaceae bacterium]|nr:WG repeat-containing protein [Flavobacteriaceae bacterium]
MKTLCIVLLMLPFLGMTQTIENIDFISSFHNDLAAVKKGNEWAFINKEGKTVIDFRSGLVSSKKDGENYPLFYNDKCLFQQEKDGVTYYVASPEVSRVELLTIESLLDTTGKPILVSDENFIDASTGISGCESTALLGFYPPHIFYYETYITITYTYVIRLIDNVPILIQVT